MSATSILFVCSGNICRSPMGEAIARHLAPRYGLDLDFRSAGTLNIVGRPADPHAVTACAEVGIDLTEHISAGITTELVEQSRWILVMEPGHAAWLRDLDPQSEMKTLLLGNLIGKIQIDDPVQKPLSAFRRCRDELWSATESFLKRLPRPNAHSANARTA